MMYMGAAIAVLTAALYFALRAWWGKRKEAAEKEAQNTALRKAIEDRDKYAGRKEEIRNEAEKKKESLHTGDNAADFNSSIGLLHNTRRDKPAADSS
jgi:hypothetical protein